MDNPPGAPGVHMSLSLQCANAPPAPCDPVQVVDNTYNIFVPEPEPLYWDPTGQYVTPPASMIPHCGERMRAYIMIDKAATRSWEVVGTYNMECDETI